MQIPFNKPYISGREPEYIRDAMLRGHISGNGYYTRACHDFFRERYSFKKCLLTTSCTDALEMSALLLDLKPGDEVIMPSYTFVSTANAFVLRGAKIVFADSLQDHPNLDVSSLEDLITERTRVIVVVHYAGMACDMDQVMQLAQKHGIVVIEDAAQAIDSYYKGKPLGSIGHMAAFSFHETKNIISGEGGMLVVNDSSLNSRAEIIWEKGTNRAAFYRGEVDKYGWVEAGSSFLPSEIIAAFLLAQLENLQTIQKKRISLWNRYYENLLPLQQQNVLKLPQVPGYSSNNAHMFYVLLPDPNIRQKLIEHLKSKGILSVFHYLSLHSSAFYHDKHDGRVLSNSDRFSDTLLRLPMFFELNENQVDLICEETTWLLKSLLSQSQSVSMGAIKNDFQK
jgi:dTDP-4-amino-4,6-dideoxygalactose transaminase